MAQCRCTSSTHGQLFHYFDFYYDSYVPYVELEFHDTVLQLQTTNWTGGTVRIDSINPFDAPLIDPNMLTTEWDIRAMRESIKSAKRFAGAPAWEGYITGSVGPLFSDSDAILDAYTRRTSSTIFHPTSTASMTSFTSKNGVTNPDLTVKGTLGLRIVDLSVLASKFIMRIHMLKLIFMAAFYSQLPSARLCISNRWTSCRSHQSRSGRLLSKGQRS